jgi:hypothetical protein
MFNMNKHLGGIANGSGILLRVFISSGTLLFSTPFAMAEEATAEAAGSETTAPSGMIGALFGYDVNSVPVLKSLGVTVGAWFAAGVTYNPDIPGDEFNGLTTFADRANTIMPNQFNLYFERATNKEGGQFDLGFRADLMIGSDARFTQATGLDDQVVQDPFDGGPRFFDFAAPQLYVEMFMPVGNGLSAKIGHFYTPIGYEVVPATGNFFYTHAYTMQYAEPFTHTGVLFSYPLTGNFTLMAGAVNGWDNWDVNPERFSGLGGLTWTSDSGATSATITGISGDDKLSGEDRSLYSIVISHQLVEHLTWVLQHDNGAVQDSDSRGTGEARWYGINSYLFYDVNDSLRAGLRGEWFHDDEGFQVAPVGFGNRAGPGFGTGASYYAITAGLNWKPYTWLVVRPEVRYDWADLSAPPGRSEPFDGGTDEEQLLFATDFVITF